MRIAMEEQKSQAPLIVFVDLLFLLVAFFTLLLFFMQAQQAASQSALETVQESLTRITGAEVNVTEALSELERLADQFVAKQESVAERERLLAERQKRRDLRDVQRLVYVVDPSGTITYQERRYSIKRFLEQVVGPLRAKKWVAFRAFAHEDTPFGRIVEIRRALLEGSNEFDTYWDNLRPNKEVLSGD